MISPKPDVKKYDIKDIEFMVLGCDGIWECASNQDVVDFVAKRVKDKKSLKDIAEELLDQILAKDT